MSIPRVKLREVLFLFLFALDFCAQDNLYALSEFIMDEVKVSRSVVRAMLEKAQIIVKEIPIIDELIKDVLVGYRMDRLKSVERTILRLLAYEMLEKGEEALPPKVVISEAKRLTKKFATVEAQSFIHAVLAQIAIKKELLVETKLEDKSVEKIEVHDEKKIQELLVHLDECDQSESQISMQFHGDNTYRLDIPGDIENIIL